MPRAPALSAGASPTWCGVAAPPLHARAPAHGAPARAAPQSPGGGSPRPPARAARPPRARSPRPSRRPRAASPPRARCARRRLPRAPPPRAAPTRARAARRRARGASARSHHRGAAVAVAREQRAVASLRVVGAPRLERARGVAEERSQREPAPARRARQIRRRRPTARAPEPLVAAGRGANRRRPGPLRASRTGIDRRSRRHRGTRGRGDRRRGHRRNRRDNHQQQHGRASDERRHAAPVTEEAPHDGRGRRRLGGDARNRRRRGERERGRRKRVQRRVAGRARRHRGHLVGRRRLEGAGERDLARRRLEHHRGRVEDLPHRHVPLPSELLVERRERSIGDTVRLRNERVRARSGRANGLGEERVNLRVRVDLGLRVLRREVLDLVAVARERHARRRVERRRRHGRRDRRGLLRREPERLVDRRHHVRRIEQLGRLDAHARAREREQRGERRLPLEAAARLARLAPRARDEPVRDVDRRESRAGRARQSARCPASRRRRAGCARARASRAACRTPRRRPCALGASAPGARAGRAAR